MIPATLFEIIPLIIICGFSLGLCLICFRPFRACYQKQTTPYTPSITVIVPCKGSDSEFVQFLRSLENQRLQSPVQYFFCVAEIDDPAVDTVQKTLSAISYEIFVSEDIPTCSYMNQNMIEGLKQLDPNGDVVAFLDADGVLDPDYIACLVAPLQDPQYDASSTYRQYIPQSLGGYIVKTWNCLSLSFKRFLPTSFIWGGGFALRQADLKKFGIPYLWETLLNEDMILTKEFRERGLKIFPVGKEVRSQAAHSISDAFRWIARQEWYSYHYNPHLKRVNAIFIVTFISALFFFAKTLSPLFLMPYISVFLCLGCFAWRYGKGMDWILLPFNFVAILLVLPYAMIIDSFIRTIDWGGIRYRVNAYGRVIGRAPILARVEGVSSPLQQSSDIFEMHRISYAVHLLKHTGSNKLATIFQNYIQALNQYEGFSHKEKSRLMAQLANLVSHTAEPPNMMALARSEVLLKSILATLHDYPELAKSWEPLEDMLRHHLQGK